MSAMMELEFWLISAPGDKTKEQTYDKVTNAFGTGNPGLATITKFNIPDLKVGTLDALMSSSDELTKLDAFTESVTRKVVQYTRDVLEDQSDKLVENLKVQGQDMAMYLQNFQWDLAKYPIKQNIKNISEVISKQMSQIEGDLKTKSQAYNNLKSNLQSLERKQTGSLLTRNLGDLVKKEHFILDSEYIVTLLVVVPVVSQRDWEERYEKLTDMIVPRSSRMVFSDNEHCLNTVSLFSRAVDEFKHKAREAKFLVRDFAYNEEVLSKGRNDITKLQGDKKKQYGPLVRWLKVNFSETFQAWIHIKAIRVFVESVLRYGLPVNFQAILLLPHRKAQKRLRDGLKQMFSHLDSGGGSGAVDLFDTPVPGVSMNVGEYFPYVYCSIRLDFLSQRQ